MKIPRILFKTVRLYKLLQKVFEVVPKYEDKPVFFNRLKNLMHIKKSMSQRVSQRLKRDALLKKREIQREKTETTKLNFVTGIMNRFFAEFLKNHCSKGIKATVVFGT